MATPLLPLSRILSDYHIFVTIITTPTNYSTIKTTVQNHPISVINIPFPNTPPSIQVTKTQTCIASSFYAFVNSTQQLQPRFEEVVWSLHPVSCIISDGFLFWTQDSAEKLGIPRLVFYGMNIFSMTMYNIMGQLKPHATVDSDDEAFVVPDVHRIKLTGNDFDPLLSEIDRIGPSLEIVVRAQKAMVRT
ncbi:putative flavanone 7-O-beta-glucosyltransferase [Helianthus anomalus]